jgi:putative PEP-CTERM system TPR-repeat lipoprotein
MSEGRTAFDAGDYRTAEIHLKNLLQQQPDDGEARGLLGRVSLNAGDLPAAEQNLRRAIEQGASRDTLEVPLLEALIGQRKFDEALAEVASAPPLTASEDRALVLAFEAVAHRGKGANDRAEASYRAALELQPTSATVLTHLASMALDLGHAGDARTQVEAALADDAQYAPALLVRSTLEVREGRAPAAEATLQQIVDRERPRAATSSTYPVALAQLANLQLTLGKVDAAAASADALLAARPQSPVARYVKAAVEVQQNDLNSAEARLESLVAEAPQYWPAHRLLGAINIQQEQLGQATQYLRAYVTNNASDEAARLQLAQIYIRQGDIDAARTLLGQAAGVSDGMFLAFVARTSQQAGMPEQAQRYFDQSEAQLQSTLQDAVGASNIYLAAGEFERAVRALQGAVTNDAQGEQLKNYLLAITQARQGDFAAAAASAEQLQRQMPGAAFPLNLRGTIALSAGDAKTATTFLEQALALEPKNVDVLFNLARAAAAENDADKAERYLENALEVDPALQPALFGLAEIAASRKDFAGAHALVARAPESPARLRAEAGVFAAEGKFAEAADALANVYSVQPSGVVALQAYTMASRARRPNPEAELLDWSTRNPTDPTSNFMLANGALERGDQDEAIRRYEAVLAVTPAHAATLNNLAWLYGERRDSRAIELGERARAADPKNPMIADTLGWLHLRAGDAAKARPLLEEATAALPSDRAVSYHYAVALAESGEAARARAILEPLLADPGDFVGREDAARRLAALTAPGR